MMPDLDGVQVLEGIRAREPEARVMLMTGHAEECVRARLRESPDVMVLSKAIFAEGASSNESKKMLRH